ncbi:hypothetical protein [Streptomyces sp. OR43]|uniref:hypothetical protein n=1 Tax=Streptomyces sp. or43 TaxID=2478957 RepID=UPI0039679982
MRQRTGERIPVVVQRDVRGRRLAARGLWTGAELVMTLGVVLLLLVAHQLWWTNRQARAEAADTVHVTLHHHRDPLTCPLPHGPHDRPRARNSPEP